MNRSQRARINRQNAQKSTGPRTDEGKDRSRLNALKHGLRAETIALPGEDADALQDTLDRWTDCYGPETPGEEALVERAALATVQLRRCARFHAAAVGEQVRQAEERWHNGREDEVERLKALMVEDPDAALRQLRRSAHGLRWLIERWERLDTLMVESGHWCGPDRDEAIRLLGYRPDRLKDHPEAYLTRLYNLMGFANRSDEAVAHLCDPKQMPESLRSVYNVEFLPNSEACPGLLREMIAANLGPLRKDAQRIHSTIDSPSCIEAADRALLLGGPEGSLLIRYEKMHESSFHRAYKAILQAQKEADAREEEAEPSVEPPSGSASAAAPNEAGGARKSGTTHCLVGTWDAVPGVISECGPGPEASSTAVPIGPTGPPVSV